MALPGRKYRAVPNSVPDPELPIRSATPQSSNQSIMTEIQISYGDLKRGVLDRQKVSLEERKGETNPEKRRGREGWKLTSITAARWPRRTETGSGGGRGFALAIAVDFKLFFSSFFFSVKKI